MTDQELQIALAKMLPEKIEWVVISIKSIASFAYWKDNNTQILDTEWLYVSWLVEQTLDAADFEVSPAAIYQETLWLLVNPGTSYERAFDDVGLLKNYTSASWQQRAEALCKVKGIQ